MKNYSTKIEVYDTITEILQILKDNNIATPIVEYKDLQPSALTFKIESGKKTLKVFIPVKIKDTLERLLEMKNEKGVKMSIKADYQQACKVAWRNIKGWLENQITMVDMGLMTLTEIFMPFVVETKELHKDINKMSRVDLMLNYIEESTMLKEARNTIRFLKEKLLAYTMYLNMCNIRVPDKYMNLGEKWGDDSEFWLEKTPKSNGKGYFKRLVYNVTDTSRPAFLVWHTGMQILRGVKIKPLSAKYAVNM